MELKYIIGIILTAILLIALVGGVIMLGGQQMNSIKEKRVTGIDKTYNMTEEDVAFKEMIANGSNQSIFNQSILDANFNASVQIGE